jgi:hypothetical protein
VREVKSRVRSNQQEEIMKKFSVLGWCLLAAVFAFYQPGLALAQVAAVSGTGTCGVVSPTDCATAMAFTPTSVRMSVSAGVTTMVCQGTTSPAPLTNLACDGERVNRASLEATPLHPCSITVGTTTVPTDDWYETISTTGAVKLTCTAGGTDLK